MEGKYFASRVDKWLSQIRPARNSRVGARDHRKVFVLNLIEILGDYILKVICYPFIRKNGVQITFSPVRKDHYAGGASGI